MLLTRRGFTIIELLMAMVLMGVVSTAIYTLLINNQRLYTQQSQNILVNDNIRSAMAIVTSELRELDAKDPAGSDIVVMAENAILYRAMRGTRWVCGVGTAPVITGYLPLDTTLLGLRSVDATYDSLLIFADSSPMLTRDDHWFHADVVSTPAAANDCGGASRRVNYALNVGGRNGLVAADDVLVGSPVRIFEIVRLMRYADVTGANWLGMQRRIKNAGYTALQPVLGPLEPGGLSFAYFDANGAPTTDQKQVARIQITVIARSSDKVVKLQSGGMGYLVDTLVTQVALRNNR